MQKEDEVWMCPERRGFKEEEEGIEKVNQGGRGRKRHEMVRRRQRKHEMERKQRGHQERRYASTKETRRNK